MAPQLTTFAAEAAASSGGLFDTKWFFMALAMFGAAMGLGLVGQAYMKAIGRNPEAGKAASQVVIIAAMIEVTALLTFLGALIIK